jgi:flagellar motor switch protein FliN/FliY
MSDQPNAFASTVVGEDRLASVMDIPVTLTVVLGEKRMPLGKLYALGRGSIIEVDKKVGEPVEIFVNDRLVARGEVQLTDEGRLAISMTEIAASAVI